MNEEQEGTHPGELNTLLEVLHKCKVEAPETELEFLQVMPENVSKSILESLSARTWF